MAPTGSNAQDDWASNLASWASAKLASGETGVLRQALPTLEAILIEAALRHTAGRRAEAAALLGWGRNTLTRKIKELSEAGHHISGS
jgi:two-component system nitrogen regulation response regulator GlnG